MRQAYIGDLRGTERLTKCMGNVWPAHDMPPQGFDFHSSEVSSAQAYLNLQILTSDGLR